MSFKGDFALLTGDGRTVHKVESVGCAFLEIDGKAIELPPSVFEAIVTEVDPVQCIVLLDQPVPEGLDGQAAVFSNPLYSRTTAYHVMSATANRIRLQANSLVLGKGRVQTIHGPKSFTSDIPHEYTWTMPRKHSTRFFDGKRILGETGGAARVVQVGIGKTLRVDVDEDIAWPLGETFEYIDLSPGDKVRIAVPRVHRLAE